MSTPTVTPDARVGSGTSYAELGVTRRSVTHRFRAIAPWVALLVVGSLILLAVGLRSAPEARLLDPRSAGPIGSMALAEVLAQNGISVDPVTSVAALPRTVQVGTTVVVTADERITPAQLTEVLARAASADRAVLLLTDPRQVSEVAPSLTAYTTVQGAGIPPTASGPATGCEIAGVQAGDVVTGGLLTMRPSSEGTDVPETCLEAVMTGEGALLAHLPANDQRPETYLVGFGPGLSNELITDEANAAVALRLLGASPRLTWLIPDWGNLPSGEAGQAYSPWPAWSTPVMWVLAGSVILLALVRGRRLGRIVPEPLPVIVRAAETTESRGHLYRRSRDRDRTARILRDATRARLRRKLGVDRDAPDTVLAQATAHATGLPIDRVTHLLTDAEPATNADLVTLGSDLADLEGKVRLS